MHQPLRTPSRRYGPARVLALLACAVFALIGSLPLALGYLLRSAAVEGWVSTRTSALLEEQWGLEASYSLRLSLWPLRLQLLDVTVEANDGGTPALRAASLSIRPRLWALLAGKLDIGEIEIENSDQRLVIRDGKLVNVNLNLPESESDAALTRAPFTSLAMSNARIDLRIDDYRLLSGKFDLDVLADLGWSFDVALRVDESSFTSPAPRALPEDVPPPLEPLPVDASLSTTEAALPARPLVDRLCQLDLRGQWQPGEFDLRRLSLLAVADDPKVATGPTSCDAALTADRQVALRLVDTQVRYADTLEEARGHVLVRAPLDLLNRTRPTPLLSGWVGFTGTLVHDQASRLPRLDGQIRSGEVTLNEYRLVQHLRGEVHTTHETIQLPEVVLGHSDGQVTLSNTVIEPFAPGVKIRTAQSDLRGIRFPALIRDIGVTAHTIVNWDIDAQVEDFGGTLDPLHLDGIVEANTQNFEVFTSGFDDPAREHVIGVPRAQVRTHLAVRPDSVQFLSNDVKFGRSTLGGNVKIGFDNRIDLTVPPAAILLEDITPLLDIPMAGRSRIEARMQGPMASAALVGKIGIDDFVFSEFPLGSLESPFELRDLILYVKNLNGTKGKSQYQVPSGSLNFQVPSAFVAEGHVNSRQLHLRDFLAMWHFDTDPRWQQLDGFGSTDARVVYYRGGKNDPCRAGNLQVTGELDLSRFELFEEYYDSARASFAFRWDDILASYLGMEVDIPSALLRKGDGVLFGSGRISHDAKIAGQVLATEVPLRKLQALGALGELVTGTVSAVAEVGGSIDALWAKAHTTVSPLRVGPAQYNGGQLSVELTPIARPNRVVGRSACGRPIPAAFDPEQYARDLPSGVFHIQGRMLGGQVQFSDFNVTRQTNKVAWGSVQFNQLDVGGFMPEASDDSGPSRGSISAKLDVKHMPVNSMTDAEGQLTLTNLQLAQGGAELGLLEPVHLAMADGQLQIQSLGLHVTTGGGSRALFDVKGQVRELGGDPELDLALSLRPTNLSAFRAFVPGAEQFDGDVSGQFAVTGRASAPSYRGGFEVRRGRVRLQDAPVGLTEMELDVRIDSQGVRLTRGQAKAGGGEVTLSGAAPLRRFELGEIRGSLSARDVSLELASGVRLAVDVDLRGSYEPTLGDPNERPLPRLVGDVTIKHFEYARPITLAADIGALTGRGRRTQFEALDLADEFLEFDLSITSENPLRVNNNLIQAAFRLDDAGLRLEGTNQRYGMRGRVRVEPGGTIRFRRNDFEIQQGELRFDDSAKVVPRVDLTAETNYRRYSSSGAASDTADGATTGTATTAGQWRITLHAYGDAESPRIDLSSEPDLSQDDIFLLLTLGLTRTELDQAQSASLGESVALEALGTLTGADKVITEVVPVIDDFRFGSAYSTRTGRTEPTVIIGKRLTERLRAFITSGITESREIRSNVEWRLNRRLSIEGSYDNVNDISSSSLGNLGSDVRWRLEFD